jgi:hypothetical protein
VRLSVDVFAETSVHCFACVLHRAQQPPSKFLASFALPSAEVAAVRLTEITTSARPEINGIQYLIE